MRKSFWIGIILSIIFLYLAFRKSNFKDILNILLSLNYYNFFYVLICSFLYICFKAVRWGYLLLPLKHISFSRLFKNSLIGQMAFYILPLRMGELVRIYSIAKLENISKSSMMGVLVLEKIFDGFVLLLLLFFAILLSQFQISLEIRKYIKSFAVVALLLNIVVLFFLIFVKIFENKILDLINRKIDDRPSARILKVVMSRLRLFMEGLRIFTDPHIMVMVGIYSLLTWLSGAGILYTTMLMFGVNGGTMASHVGFIGANFVCGVISIGLMIPSSPGFIGTFQWMCKMALLPFGLEQSLVDSYSIFVHGSQYILMTSLGLTCFWREHLAFREITPQKAAYS